MESNVSQLAFSERVNPAYVQAGIGDFRAADAAAIADLLDGLPAGLFLVDRGARILHANASGRAILASGEVLTSSGGRLVPRGAEARLAFRRLLGNAVEADTDGMSLGSVALAADDGECWVAHVLPISGGSRPRDALPCVAVLVRKARLGLPAPDMLARIYRLTPAELRILLAVVEIGGVPDIAAVFGISEATVKTHLRRLFSKTNTCRQADLVKLVAGFVNPLGG